MLAAFINGSVPTSEPLIASIQKLESSRQAKGLKTFVVYMGGPNLKPAIQKVGKDVKVSIPLVYLPKGPKGEDIATYKINPSVKNTILLWHGQVRSSFVNVDEKSFAQVQKATDAMLR